jgi:hypothetical protein
MNAQDLLKMYWNQNIKCELQIPHFKFQITNFPFQISNFKVWNPYSEIYAN